MDEMIRVSIIDNDRLLMESTAQWFSGLRDIRIIHTTETVDEYLRLKANDDLVLLDLILIDGSVPTQNVARLVRENYRVLVISGHYERQMMLDVLEAGAHGFLDKNDGLGALVQAIRDCRAGATLTQAVAFAIVRDRRAGRPPLSELESQAVALFARGMTSGAVAMHMNISEESVQAHLSRVAEKYKTRPPAERPRLSDQELQAAVLYATGMTAAAVGQEMNIAEKTVRSYLNRTADKYKAVGRPYNNKIELKERLAEDGIDTAKSSNT